MKIMKDIDSGYLIYISKFELCVGIDWMPSMGFWYWNKYIFSISIWPFYCVVRYLKPKKGFSNSKNYNNSDKS